MAKDPRSIKKGMSKSVIDSQKAKADTSLTYIDLNDINEHPLNHFSMDEDKIIELAQDIAKHGMLEIPLVWNNQDGKTELLSGHRRFRAYQWLRDNVDAEKYDKMMVHRKLDVNSPAEALLILHSANLYTRELKPSERARSIALIHNEADTIRQQNEEYKGVRTNDLVADSLTASGTTISARTIATLVKIDAKLSNEMKGLWDKGIITQKQAENICNLTDKEQSNFYEYAKGHTEPISNPEYEIIREMLLSAEPDQKEPAKQQRVSTAVDIDKRIKKHYRNLRKTVTELVGLKESGVQLDPEEIKELKEIVNNL